MISIRGVKPPSRPATFAVNVEARKEAERAYVQGFCASFGHYFDVNLLSDVILLASEGLDTGFRRWPVLPMFDLNTYCNVAVSFKLCSLMENEIEAQLRSTGLQIKMLCDFINRHENLENVFVVLFPFSEW